MSPSCARSLAAALALALALVACAGEPQPPPGQSEDVEIAGQLAPLTATTSTSTGNPYENLQVVALGPSKLVRTAAIDASGSFRLGVTPSLSYVLNVFNIVTRVYVGSFLFRAGTKTSVVMNIARDRIDLGRCQVLNGEVWCENGFFDAPSASGSVSPSNVLGGVELSWDPNGEAAQVLRQFIGGDKGTFEIHQNSANPFNVAIFNRTKGACAAPLVGTSEKVGNEQYFYTENVYQYEKCRAHVRYQLTCSFTDAATCEGFLRVDVTSFGDDCSAAPSMHAAQPVTARRLATHVNACSPPPACASDADCASGVCLRDAAYCQAAPPPTKLRVYQFDVGTGDAQLFIGPDGTSLLVDGGRTASGRMLAGLIRRLAGKLDYMVATQYDSDHAGGLPAIVLGPDGAPGRRAVDDDQNGTVDDPTENGAEGSDDLLPKVALDRGLVPKGAMTDAWVRAVGARRREAVVGEVIKLGSDDVTATVVASAGRVLGRAEPFDAIDENERCVGLSVKHGKFGYLTLADLPGVGARKIELAAGEAVAADAPFEVLHASHHGSAASSQPDFLALVRPLTAIISTGDSDTCGAGFNTYGLPSQAVLTNLAAAGVSHLFQTQTGGSQFVTGCQPTRSETYPRQYGGVPTTFSYGTIELQVSESSFVVSGAAFRKSFDVK